MMISGIPGGIGESLPVKEQIRFLIYSTLTILSPVLSTKIQYRIQNGKPLDLDNPRSFSEKLSWLKLYAYADDPLVRQCADKLAVRDYVRSCGFGDTLNELFGVYQSPEEIPWDLLPKRFVLKWNFGCGFNFHAEMQYKGIEPRILCEHYIDSPAGQDLTDYKFYSFSGKVLAILVIERKHGLPERAAFMSPDWEYLSDIPSRYSESFLPSRPVSLSRMIEAAERLSAPFPFVRVDFYEQNGRPVFGEMTFTPAASINPSECMINGRSMGELLCFDTDAISKKKHLKCDTD